MLLTKPGFQKISSLLAGFFVFSLANGAAAFTLNSQSDSSLKGWSNPSLEFHLNPANCPAGIRDMVGDALGVWNGVATSKLNLSLGADSSSTYSQLHSGSATDVPVIVCDTNFSADSGIGGNGIAGVGLVATPVAGGRISYGFLLINVESGSTGNIATQSSTIVSLVLAHEIGHVLGLGHSPDTTALMYYNASAKSVLSLAQDDIDGITYLYPRNEPTDKVAGCALVRSLADAGKGKGPGGPQILLSLLMMLAPLALAWLLRFPRRSPGFA